MFYRSGRAALVAAVLASTMLATSGKDAKATPEFVIIDDGADSPASVLAEGKRKFKAGRARQVGKPGTVLAVGTWIDREVSEIGSLLRVPLGRSNLFSNPGSFIHAGRTCSFPTLQIRKTEGDPGVTIENDPETCTVRVVENGEQSLFPLHDARSEHVSALADFHTPGSGVESSAGLREFYEYYTDERRFGCPRRDYFPTCINPNRKVRTYTTISDANENKEVAGAFASLVYRWQEKTKSRCIKRGPSRSYVICGGRPGSACWRFCRPPGAHYFYDTYTCEGSVLGPCIQQQPGKPAHVGCLENTSYAASLWNFKIPPWGEVYVGSGWEPRNPSGRDMDETTHLLQYPDPTFITPNGTCPFTFDAERRTEVGPGVFKGVGGDSIQFTNLRSDSLWIIWKTFGPSEPPTTSTGGGRFMWEFANLALDKIRFSTPTWVYAAVTKDGDTKPAYGWYAFKVRSSPWNIPYRMRTGEVKTQ